MILFNGNWQFALDKPEDFVPVVLPHDWLIHDPRNLYKSGVGYYKKTFDPGDMYNKRVYLCFDGVYMDSELWVNGVSAGMWKYGYTAFCHDITDYLRKGENELLLTVNYQAPNSRWYTGAGIYRDVFLDIRNSCHIKPGGVYVTPRKLPDGRWEVSAEAEAVTGGLPCVIRHTVVETGGLVIDKPKLWDIGVGNLYTLRSELMLDGHVTDTVMTRFGLRETEFTPEGFYLNGRRIKLQGVCLHHDLGLFGAAFNKDAARRQLRILRDMGVNAVRTAHNPPARAFMELADEMGVLVVSELLDMWRRPKNKYDYARFFDDWIEKDVEAWVRRDRNSPSVILWSVGNEIYDTHADPEEGGGTLKALAGMVKGHDPKSHAPVTFCSNYMPWENTQKCADIVKIIGYNYAESLYDRHHGEHPDWVIYGGETCSTVQSRGVYHFPLDKPLLWDDDLQCSALGNSRTSWGAASVEACVVADRDAAFSAGQFVWSGFDYLGEPTPYHTKNSYLGHVDTAGFPKDSYYIFQAAWTDYKTAPMVHLFPYWDFSPGQPIDVRAVSNAPRVELFLNGVSQGVFKCDKTKDKSLVGNWRINYEPGVLTAVAYGEDGREAARAVRSSFGDTESLIIKEERVGELVFYEITAEDSQGNPVENANDKIEVEVLNGTLLGLDNGDATDYTPFQSNNRRMFGGKLMAAVKQTGDEPPTIRAKRHETDIPIRKIELLADGFQVTAKIHPKNAAYNDLVWRLTDSGGVDSPLGTLCVSADGLNAVVTPTGDGLAYIRCGAKNGGEHMALYSLLPINIQGHGTPKLDPYAFISAGLYNWSNAELGNGNERGVATLRDGESHVGFEGVDFGGFGSDELTVWLFPLDKEPFTFEIWEGMPGTGGTLLLAPVYDKGSVWNTYQPATYVLPGRLRGVTTISFKFTQKVHIKGFIFAKREKAFERLDAAMCDDIYGDAYIKGETAVTGIGNNVTMTFNDMDFGDGGAGSLELSWRSRRERNSIQLVFTGEGGEREAVMLEAGANKDYNPCIFSLETVIRGRKDVSLVFLPGCEIDIGWIRFIKL